MHSWVYNGRLWDSSRHWIWPTEKVSSEKGFNGTTRQKLGSAVWQRTRLRGCNVILCPFPCMSIHISSQFPSISIQFPSMSPSNVHQKWRHEVTIKFDPSPPLLQRCAVPSCRWALEPWPSPWWWPHLLALVKTQPTYEELTSLGLEKDQKHGISHDYHMNIYICMYIYIYTWIYMNIYECIMCIYIYDCFISKNWDLASENWDATNKNGHRSLQRCWLIMIEYRKLVSIEE